MNEPWYEAQGPNTEEVRNKLLEIYISPNGKYNLVSLTAIKKVINDVISVEEKNTVVGVHIEDITHLHIII